MESLRTFGFLLKDISRLYSRNFERHAARFCLTLDQCRVLTHLARNEGISQARLAYLTDTDPMTLGRILERMEGDGLVERRPDPDDRRTRTLFLQSAAAPLLREIWRLSDIARAEAFSGMGVSDKAQLLKLMKHVHANLGALLPGTADLGKGTPQASSSRSRARAGVSRA
jgi:DNA-binding MarR family transcriptional regulator